MERKVLVFGLLQFLSLFESADSDFNGTSMDNGIETDMASIEEYTRTLPIVESPDRNATLNSDQLPKSLLPFGAFKTDWTRLHLLRDALPRDSVVKQKFEHLFRLLLVAYNQAIQFSSSSKSTKSQDILKSGTAVPVSISKGGNVQKINEKQPRTEDDINLISTGTTLIELPTTSSSVDLDLETPSSSTSISNPIQPLSNYIKDDVDSVTIKSISQHSTGHDEERSTVRTDILGTGLTGGGVEPFTPFVINVSSSTKTVLKKTFDRPTIHKDCACPEKPSKMMTTMDGQSPSSTPSGRGLERTQKDADSLFSHQSSIKIVPVEETSIVNEFILAVSTSAFLESQPSYSSSREDLATLTKTENSIGSPDSITMNPKKHYSTYEDYSSATMTLSYETMGDTSSTASQKEQLLLSATEENHLNELTPATLPVNTSEKNKPLLLVMNIPPAVAEEEESLSSKTQSQSTWEVKHSTEEVSSSIEEFSTTLSTVELYTAANVWLTKNSTESSSIYKERKNEEMKPEEDTEFLASEKSTGNKQYIWDSTPGSTLAYRTSTDSTNTRQYINERSTTVTVAKASDLPGQGQYVNENDSNGGSTTDERTGSRKATDKPNYIKNPLHADSSRSNDIFRDFKHRSQNVGTDRSPESERMILYESGGSAKSGDAWRPHLVRVPPVGNNIRRFDNAPENARTHRNQRPSPSAVTRANSSGELPVSSNKGPFPSRTNLLMPRKRGSANADIEKLFRWFYTRGQIKPSNKSRSNERDNTNIMMQCKKTQ